MKKTFLTKQMDAFQLVCGGKKAGIANVQVGMTPAFRPDLNVLYTDGSVSCMKISKQVAQVLQDIGFGSEG
jgi:prepilin-type processing-associated H-X9-DG protein